MIKIVQEKLSEELKQKVCQGFDEHAIQETGLNEFGDYFAFIAKKNNDILGLVSYRPFWGAMHIKYMWIAEKHRKKGIGTKLMNKALKFGSEEGFRYVFLETMSFQAPLFYQKLGFKIDFVRANLSHNISFYYLSKDLI
jgi:ribosomal protein S18 acetylase RimI-like enzyme